MTRVSGPVTCQEKSTNFSKRSLIGGGLVAEVIEGGTITKGDTIIIKAQPHEGYYYRNRQD